MIYVVSIFISGIVNIYLSLYATAGWIVQIGFEPKSEFVKKI